MKNNLSFLLSIVILFFCVPLMGQKTINKDSLIVIAGNDDLQSKERFIATEGLILHYANSNVDSMILWIDYAYGFVDTMENSYMLGRLFYFDGERYFKTTNYSKAIKRFDQSQQIFDSKDKLKDLSSSYYGKALVYLYSGSMDSVMYYSTKALAGFEELKDTFRQVGTLLNMVQVQNQMGNLNSSKKNLDKAKHLVFDAQIKNFFGTTYVNYGILHYNFARKYQTSDEPDSQSKQKVALDSSLYYYDLAEDTYKEMNQEYFLVNVLFNKSLIYQDQQRWSRALSTLEEVKTLAEKNKNPAQVARTNSSIADCLAKLGKPLKAVDILKENIDILKEKKDKVGLVDAYNNLSTVYAGMNDYENAYYYKNLQLDEKLESLDETTIAKVNDLEKKYETEKKENEIERLSLVDNLNQLKIQNQRYWLFGTLAGLGLLSFLLFRLFGQKKKIESQNQIISKSLKEKDILLREIHHRVKNNLQLVSSLLGLQSNYIQDANALQAINSGKLRVKSMALIHQNLYNKENLTGVSVREYIEKLSTELMGSFNVGSDQVKLHCDIPDMLLDVDTLVPLGLIINELLTNALKYAFPDGRSGNIYLKVSESNDQLMLNFSDDGIGMDLNKRSAESFGYKLIDTLLEQLEGEMQIKNENGTQLFFQFKDYKIAA